MCNRIYSFYKKRKIRV